jgi:hypothetical protein
MAKLYTLTDADIEDLHRRLELAKFVDRPMRAPVPKEVREEAHRMFNYEVRTWLAEVCK